MTASRSTEHHPRPTEHYFRQLEEMSSRIAELHAHTAKDDREHSIVEAAIAELGMTIEELRVADEEIRQQTEELLTARNLIEDQRYRYEEMFELAPDGYLVTDPQGRIEEANQAAVRLLGCPRRLLTGKPLVTFIPKEDRAAFFAKVNRLASQTHPQEWELRLRPRNSEPFDAAVTVGVVRDRRGDASALRWLLRDATSRRLAEEQRFREIASEITDYGIIRLDSDGLIRGWNRGAERMLGYVEAEVMDRHVGTLLSGEERALGVAEREIEEARAHGRCAEACWFVARDGRRLWAENVMTALHDGMGNVIGFVSVLRDLTADRIEREALSAAYQQEHRIAEALQHTMLQKVPSDQFPGLTLEVFYQPALDEAHVGGDFFDAVELPGGRIGLLVGDVSGKGLAAASRTTELRYALRAYLDEHESLAGAVSRLNQYVCRAVGTRGTEARWEGSFAAVSLLALDPSSGDAEIVAAGVEAALVLDVDGSCRVIESGGVPLGVVCETQYDSTRFTLAADEIVVLATDGLAEARAEDRYLDLAGVGLLAGEVVRGMDRPVDLDALGTALMLRVREFAGGNLPDDACLLLARRS